MVGSDDACSSACQATVHSPLPMLVVCSTAALMFSDAWRCRLTSVSTVCRPPASEVSQKLWDTCMQRNCFQRTSEAPARVCSPGLS